MKDILISGILIFGMYQIFIRVKLFRNECDVNHEILKAELASERNKQVYFFREILRYKFGSDVLHKVASYNDMLNSDKPLEAKHWVDIDKLVNLN